MECKIYGYLLEIGCCKYCCLRYLPDRNIDFNNIDEHINKRKLANNDSSVLEDDLQIKKYKANSCVVCLGLLQDHVIDDVVNRVLLSEIQKYDAKTFTCSISIPVTTIIREHAIRIALKDKFSEFYTNDVEEYPINKAWKMIIKNKLSQKLNMTFENSDTSNFSINVIMEYTENNKELSIIKNLTNVKAQNGELFSRKSVSNILSNCSFEKFKETFKIPPEVPTSHLICKHIENKHNAIYLAGRYCKYSRELSQSPWIIDGVKTMESSVEEIIFEQIDKVFCIPTTDLKFSASGREDCDVRCLGKGRPFYIEVSDPKKTNFNFQDFRQLELKINESPLIQVRDLQCVPRADLVKIKEGEQMKTKDYVALCITNSPVNQEILDRINSYGQIILEQKTPIRVLHRRPLAVRNKTVYSMYAKLIPDQTNLFELSLVTEAGTYVKEFVHGDFGRTKPSVGDIIKMEVDIVALDVLSINLDWPEEIIITNML